MESLQQLEQLCVDFYSPDPNAQRRAHQTLFPLVSNIQSIPQFQAILAQSQDPQALLFAANALLKLFTAEWCQVEEQQKKSTRGFLLAFLFQKGKALLPTAPLTINALVRLLVRIVRLQWIEDVTTQNICDQVAPFLQSSTADWVIGIQIYCELTRDMAPTIGGGLAKARRTAFSFRDTALPIIFKTAVETLQQICSGAIAVTNPKEETQLLKQVLQLTLSCLSFDFMAIIPDDTSDDTPDLVMIPASWTIIKEVDIPTLLFNIYSNCCQNPDLLRIECARLCMECLVQTASLRPSYFTKQEDRMRHLSSLFKLITSILKTGAGISIDDQCYHEFCRLLGKIGSSVPMDELRTCLSDRSDSTKPSTPTGGITWTGGGLIGAEYLKPRTLEIEEDWSGRHLSIVDWLSRVCEFTLTALSRWTYQQNSKHYLMSFWNSLVSRCQGSANKLPKDIRDCIQLVFRSFVESCLKIGEVTVLYEIKDDLSPETLQSIAPLLLCDITQLSGAEMVEDPLEHEVFRTQQLNAIMCLSKVSFSDSIGYVMNHWMETIAIYQQQKLPKVIVERRLIWLIYIIGALIGSNRHTVSLPEINYPYGYDSSRHTHDRSNDILELTKDIAGKVFGLITGQIPGIDMNLVTTESLEHYELACLYFMEAFRHIYFNSMVTQRNGSDVAEDLLTALVTKLIFNLKSRCLFDQVLKQSLTLIHDLSTSVVVAVNDSQQPQVVVSGRLILKRPIIASLLNAETSRDIVQGLDGIKSGRHRTSFYSSLTKLFFLSVSGAQQKAEADEAEALDGPSSKPKVSEQVLFHEFLAPLADVIGRVWPASVAPIALGGPPAEKTRFTRPADDPEQRTALAALFRDLRGVCQACLSPESYLLFFNWLVNRPKHIESSRIHIISMALEEYWDCYPVAIAALRFAVELTTNKTGRISFQVSSPNGIILFREVSVILQAYAPGLLNKPIDQFQDVYREKYKGLALTLQLFYNASSGNFANLGAFKAYGDEALPAAIWLGIRMCLAIPEEELQSYTKILKSYYSFLELITKSHMVHLLELDSPSLARLIRTLEDGICSFQSTMTLQSWASLQNITGYFLARLNFEDPAKRQSAKELPTSEEDAQIWDAEAKRIRQFLEQEPTSLRRVLQLSLQIVIYGEGGSTWAMSGALLGLILLHPDEFEKIRDTVVAQQRTEEKRKRMGECFDMLMDGVLPDMSTASRDAFAKNLHTFPQNVRKNVFQNGE